MQSESEVATARLEAMKLGGAHYFKNLSTVRRQELLAEWQLMGLDDKSMQALLGISKTTLWRWKKGERYQQRLLEQRGQIAEDHLDAVGRVLDGLLAVVEERLAEEEPDLVAQLLKIAAPQLIAEFVERGKRITAGPDVPHDGNEERHLSPTSNRLPRVTVEAQGTNGDLSKKTDDSVLN